MKKISKKMISVIMSICLLIQIVPLKVKAANSDSIKRYIVLVLDTSASSKFYSNDELIYTADTSINDVKRASEKFLSDITKANGKNSIAVVSYKNKAEVVSQFTENVDALKKEINQLSASETTRSIADGLSVAKALLDNISDKNAIKDIVLFTTGMTNTGEYSYTGHYDENTVGSNWERMDNNVRLYAYANNSYKKAAEIKENGAYIYSIGLFQTLSEMPEQGKDIVEFFKLTAKDLASGDNYFYPVYDPNDLEFVFGEVAEDVINDNKDKDPIIVIPGIMGSRLFMSDSVFDDTTKVWDPVIDLDGIIKLDERLNINNTLYVRPCENQNIDVSLNDISSTVDDYGKEYGAADAYKSIVESLCTEFSYKDKEQYRPVYVFNYDWRYSNEDSAKLLRKEIQKILEKTGASQVDLVCHSMGGLVASSYYSQFADEKEIDKIITCGTPYEGAPKLINAVENWDVLGTDVLFSNHASLKDNFSDIMLGIFGGMTKKLKSSFAGVTELTPTQNYVKECPMQKDSKWPFNYGDYNLSYNQYIDQCRKIFTEKRYDNAVSFQNSLLNADGFNKLIDYDKSFFSVGINHATICSIKFQCINQDIDEKLYESDLEYTILGDGTVPYLSASIMEKIEKLSPKGERWNQFDANHNQTINGEKSIKWIIDILTTGKSNIEGAEKNDGAYTVVRIACPVEVSVEIDDEKLKSDNENLSIITDFGRLDFVGQEDEIKMLCFNDNDDYNISIHGTDAGTMDYTIRFYDNEKLIEERKIESVPVSENTIIKTDTNKKDDTFLWVDVDGDGETDNILTLEKEHKKNIERIDGTSRYETGMAVADELKAVLGVEKFETAIIATGNNFVDALSGSYLAAVKDAPILLTNGKAFNVAELHEYIKANVTAGGTIYVLGGESVVSAAAADIDGYNVERISGKNRYETNLAILEKAGLEGDDLIVAAGKGFADSLSASATGKPILLVKQDAALSDAQKAVAANFKNIYVIGGTGAVSEAIEKELEAYGEVVRIDGTSRYETSVAVAENFFEDVDKVLIASGKNFPDGLCGGPLAAALNAPLVLTRNGSEAIAAYYVATNEIVSGYVLGGERALAEETVTNVFGIEKY